MRWCRLAKTLHPDKNPENPEAASAKFMEMKDMYDALKDDDQRRIYDRFGQKFYESPHHDAWIQSPTSMAFQHISWYGGMIFLILVTTFDRKSSRSKLWSFSLLFIMLIYELLIKYDDTDWDYFIKVLPYMSVYQKVELLHLILMYSFHVLSQYAAATFVDLEDGRYKDLRMRIEILSDQLQEVSDGMEGLMEKMKVEVTPKEILLDENKQPLKGPDGKPLAGKELRRRIAHAKIQQRHMIAQNGGPAPAGGGTNWLQMIIYAVIIYGWFTGKD
jgi:curved DNA-binding protein CbpA